MALLPGWTLCAATPTDDAEKIVTNTTEGAVTSTNEVEKIVTKCAATPTTTPRRS